MGYFHFVSNFTLEYWKDDGWLVGRLKEIPAVMSQGETIEDLKENIRDAYELVVADATEAAETPSQKSELVIAL